MLNKAKRIGEHEAQAVMAFVERQFALSRRYFAWEIVFLFYTIGNTLTIAFIAIGMQEQGHQVKPDYIFYLVIGALMWGFSGIYYPVSALPQWLQVFSVFSPATYALQGVRAALLEGAGWDILGPILLRLFLMAGVLIPLGLFIFGLAEAYAKRAGLLKRNG